MLFVKLISAVQYMVKVVDVKSKRGVDFAEHLQGYSKSMKKYVVYVVLSGYMW